MKLTILLVILSVGTMAVIILQAVRQEMTLHNLKTLRREKAAEVVRKEQSITELKETLQDLKPRLLSIQTMTEEIKGKKDDLQKSTNDMEASLQTCNKEKADADNKKADVTGTLSKKKAEHEEAKQNAQKEIQGLKQQNLDREKSICALIDTTIVEARKLCGLP